MHTVQHSTVQYNTIQYNTVQYSTVQYSTVQYSTAQQAACMHIKSATCYLLRATRYLLVNEEDEEETGTDAGSLLRW